MQLEGRPYSNIDDNSENRVNNFRATTITIKIINRGLIMSIHKRYRTASNIRLTSII